MTGACKRSEEGFNITSVCKDDLISHYTVKYSKIPKRLKKINNVIKSMDCDDMRRLAEKMANDYVEQMFWISLEILFESMFLNKD